MTMGSADDDKQMIVPPPAGRLIRRTYTERGRGPLDVTRFPWMVREPEPEAFVAYVRELLKVGTTQEISSRDAGQITGVNYVTITNMLRGIVPGYETLVRFTWALGGNVNRMLSITGHRPFPSNPQEMERLGLIPDGYLLVPVAEFVSLVEKGEKD